MFLVFDGIVLELMDVCRKARSRCLNGMRIWNKKEIFKVKWEPILAPLYGWDKIKTYDSGSYKMNENRRENNVSFIKRTDGRR